MKKYLIIGLLAVLLGSHARAEMRTWTSTTGETVEGEYVSMAFEQVKIRKANGQTVELPMALLTEEDRRYVGLLNPPELSIDYRESQKTVPVTADPWIDNGGGTHQNHQVSVCTMQYGALIKQKSSAEYPYKLTIEMYAFTYQYYDPNKYHLIAKMKSKPFVLSKENKREFLYEDGVDHRMFYYNLYTKFPRGERPSKYLILIRDERGEVIAHRALSEWLWKYLDRLQELPVGAWMNDECIRVHPTSPDEPWDTRHP